MLISVCGSKTVVNQDVVGWKDSRTNVMVSGKALYSRWSLKTNNPTGKGNGWQMAHFWKCLTWYVWFLMLFAYKPMILRTFLTMCCSMKATS